MYVVIARAAGRPDQRAALVRALTTLADASRQDPGCRSYGFYADVQDENSFVSVEEWESREQLDAHFATPHLAAFMSAAGDLLAAPPTIDMHEVAATYAPPGS